ncbi:MAG: T9SS type A sorting domain-containing protein [Crocinitomicaceae bacterium]
MKKIYTLLGILLLSGLSFGQSPYQIAQYDFAQNQKYAPNGITYIRKPHTQSADRANFYTENFDSGFGIWTPAIQQGPADFKLTQYGHKNSASNTFQIPSLASSTPTQWVIIDSDSANTSYTNAEAATLTSGLIDLSSSSGQNIAFEFEQFFAEWQPVETSDHTYLGVSTDGTNWTEIEINEGVGRNARSNPEIISWDITDIVSGSLSTVYLRFRWEGAWNYGWQIDNVQINDIPDNDLTITETWRTYSSNAGLQYSKIPQAHTEELIIGAIIKNIGHNTQTGATFNYEIFDPSMTSVASGTANTTIILDNMQQDTIFEATGYTPSSLGTYTIRWNTTSNEGDDNVSNDTIWDDHLEITEYTYATDYNEGSAEGITNWPLLTGEAFFGNLYEFQTQDIMAALDVKIANNSSNVGEIIIISIYRFADGGTQWDTYYDDYDAHTLTASDIGNIITIPFASGLDVFPLDLYLITVGQYATTSEPLFEKQGDIGWNYIQGRDENGDNRGFFDRLAPIVRPRIIDEVGVEEESENNFFTIYPNPAQDNLNVYMSFEKSKKTKINVVDISGKIIRTVNLGNVNGSKNFSISLEGMSTGVYFIELVNESGKEVKKFVKK